MHAFSFTIDSRTNAASDMWFFFASTAGFASRSGPIVAVEPAGLNVWQLPQAFVRKTAFPFAAFPAADGAGDVLVAVVVFAGAAAAVVVDADAAVTVRVTVRVPPAVEWPIASRLDWSHQLFEHAGPV